MYNNIVTPHLSLSLLGPYQVSLNGRNVEGFSSDKERALLAYLAVEFSQDHRRDALAGLLWPNMPDRTARNNLRLTLHRLRQTIGDINIEDGEQDPILHVDRETIRLNQASCWVDVAGFDSLLLYLEDSFNCKPERCEVCLPRLEEAVRLYRGEFMQGFYLDDSLEFSEWMVVKREWLHRRALWVMYRLTDCYRGRGNYDRALTHARQQLILEPWREEAHRQVMGILARRGEFSAALAQYETCAKELAKELGVPPSEETESLYQRIAAARSNRHKLPIPLTPFVGRQAELGRMADLLSHPACRLLTLCGPGGIGKTRLALQSAQRLSGSYMHGTVFVPLAGTSSPDHLYSSLASALEFLPPGRGDLRQGLLTYLQEKEMLLVLDNFEHLVEGAGLLVEILEAAPEVKILVTSRHRLNLHSEWVIDLYGLQYPVQDEQAERLEDFDAVKLFSQSARRVCQEFYLSERDKPHVARICRLVEGTPLAIELAASWTRTLTVDVIARNIARSPAYLSTSLRDIPERHRSMRAVFEGSWILLDEDEKRSLRSLSVFRGGFDEAAASSFVGVAQHTLAALQDKSLLRRSPLTGRYEFHELLRQFAMEKLREFSGEEERARDRHSAYYLEFLEAQGGRLQMADQQESLRAMEGEIQNLRAALQWATRRWRVPSLAKVIYPLFLFFYIRGWLHEGVQAFETISEQAGACKNAQTVNPALVERVHGMAMASRARCLMDMGQLEQAKEISQESLEIARRHGDPVDLAFALVNQGSLAGSLEGDYEKANLLLAESLELLRGIGQKFGIAQVLDFTGSNLYTMGRYAEAEAAYREALTIRQEIGDRRGIANAMNNLGCTAFDLGDYDRAARLFQEGLDIHREMGFQWGMANCLDNLSCIAYLKGDHVEARRYCEESLTLRRIIGLRYGIAYTLTNLATIAELAGKYEEARWRCQEGLAICREINHQWGITYALINLGHAETALGEPAEAERCYTEALQIAIETRSEPNQLDAIVGIAGLMGKYGRRAISEHIEKALELLAMVLAHPALRSETRGRTEKLWSELSGQVSADQIEAASRHGKALPFEETVKELLVA